MRAYQLTFALVVSTSLVATACDEQKGSPAVGPAEKASSAAPAMPKGTVITPKVPAKGTKRHAKENFTMSFSIEAVAADGKVVNKSDFRRRQEHQTEQEVLDANDEAPTRVRVTYVKRTEIETDAKGKEKAKPKNPVEGNTYVVERKGDDVVVTRPDGEPVGPKEAEEVKKAERDVGQPDPFAAVFADRPLKKGETIALPKALVKRLFGGNEEMDLDVEKATLTFQGAKDHGGETLATFVMALEVVGHPNEGLAMRMKLEGTMVVETATGRPASVTLKGPLKIDGKDAKRGVDLRGKGEMTIDTTYRYE